MMALAGGYTQAMHADNATLMERLDAGIKGRQRFELSTASWASLTGLMVVLLVTLGYARCRCWRITRPLGYFLLLAYPSLLLLAFNLNMIQDQAHFVADSFDYIDI